MTYEISPITVYDGDKELFETHVGLSDEKRTLLFSAWGKTKEESRNNGIAMCFALCISYNDRIEDLKNVLVGFMAVGCPNTRELRWTTWFEQWIQKYDSTGEIYKGKYKNNRQYPLTEEECTPIIGEGAESAEEL